ncbi:MAG: DUF262 domain-containing protein [Candidatus Saccharibacteria bacterium]|nr:DUF262 domain-containing protein [Candidatus Saccharibacteria bacterium]
MTINQESMLSLLETSANFQFEIPIYQRNYSWTTSQAETLLEDLERIIRNPNQDQFFGNIICESDLAKAVIIDGQQRITTIFLMMIAIYHLVSDDPQKSQTSIQVIQDFLIRGYRGEESSEIRLKLKTYSRDKEVLEQIYSNEVSLENKKTLLWQAYSKLREGLASSDIKDLFQYIEALQHMVVARIDLKGGDDSPLMIFESINSKGVELSLSDKIRNRSLLTEDESTRQHIYKNYWQKIEHSLVDIPLNRNDLDDFFKTLVIKHFKQDITNKEAYQKFKDYLDKKGIRPSSPRNKLEEHYKSVEKDLKIYLFLRYQEHAGNYEQTLVRQVRRIAFTKMTAPIPFMMEVIELHNSGQLTLKEVLLVFGRIEAVLVRRHVCKWGSNVVYKTLFALQNKLDKKAHKSYTNIFQEEIIKLMPKDSDVDHGIKNISHKTKHNILKLLLCSPDDQKSKEVDLFQQLLSDQPPPTIEHIMPQTLNSDWIKDLGSDYKQIQEDYLDRLSNLTLTSYNSEYGNKSFTEKLNMSGGFKQSPFFINSWIKKQDVWNKNTMDKRANWWSKQINEIWAYDIPIIHYGD